MATGIGINGFGRICHRQEGGGMGVVLGRRAFRRPLGEGIRILNLVQDIYLDSGITVA